LYFTNTYYILLFYWLIGRLWKLNNIFIIKLMRRIYTIICVIRYRIFERLKLINSLLENSTLELLIYLDHSWPILTIFLCYVFCYGCSVIILVRRIWIIRIIKIIQIRILLTIKSSTRRWFIWRSIFIHIF
jgi:hypothetical protein